MAGSINDQIRARVESFVEDLSELIRDSAMDTVREALGGLGDTRRGGRLLGHAAALAGGGGRGGGLRAVGRGRPKGAKRSPEEIDKLTDQLIDYIKNNPGQRIEQIAGGMGTSTKELNLPVKKLINQKQIRTKGQKRATQYFGR